MGTKAAGTLVSVKCLTDRRRGRERERESERERERGGGRD